MEEKHVDVAANTYITTAVILYLIMINVAIKQNLSYSYHDSKLLKEKSFENDTKLGATHKV